MDNTELAELLFPNIKETVEDLEKRYPKRNLPENAEVTRFAPSPTGYMHIGGLYASLISNRLASQTNGIFYLRIEDTDKKREIKDGFEEIINSLTKFGILFDEGPFIKGSNKVSYAPYRQSERRDIYQICVKYLVMKGLAYPCFCEEEELKELRKKQESIKADIGYYGIYAKCRNLTDEEINEKINNHIPYVIRLKSPGSITKRIKFHDLVRGDIEMPENIHDVIILKKDGIPTYHFAHIVDDYFMRTTTVVRGDEWLSSWPIHYQLFNACGFEQPKYLHIAPITKMEGTTKRKLSKRKDPEAAVNYYYENGIPVTSVIEYLLTLSNSNYEEWRMENPEKSNTEFVMSIKKMSNSGALFDIVKLKDISKEVIANMSVDECYDAIVKWGEQYDQNLYELARQDKAKFEETINLWKYSNGKVRKDISMWSELCDMFDYLYKKDWSLDSNCFDAFEYNDVKQVIATYEASLNLDLDSEQWFNDLKNIAILLNYAENKKLYKQNPTAYKGTIADFCTIIRIAITGKSNSPDLYTILKILGNEEVTRRFEYVKKVYVVCDFLDCN